MKHILVVPSLYLTAFAASALFGKWFAEACFDGNGFNKYELAVTGRFLWGFVLLSAVTLALSLRRPKRELTRLSWKDPEVLDKHRRQQLVVLGVPVFYLVCYVPVAELTLWGLQNGAFGIAVTNMLGSASPFEAASFQVPFVWDLALTGGRASGYSVFHPKRLMALLSVGLLAATAVRSVVLVKDRAEAAARSSMTGDQSIKG